MIANGYKLGVIAFILAHLCCSRRERRKDLVTKQLFLLTLFGVRLYPCS